MKLKTSALLIAATLMVVAVGPLQARCGACKAPGWHMVKQGQYQPAVTWQAYYSGGYLQPVAHQGWWLFAPLDPLFAPFR